MKISPRYGSHLPVLVQALAKTSGRVLELGVGAYSTPLLHAVCTLEKRHLYSFENDPAVFAWAKPMMGDYHSIFHVTDWGRASLEGLDWDVALVDHSPSERRIVDIKRLAARTRYIIVHDTNGRYKEYNYPAVWPLFQYKLDFTALQPSTTVLSNLVSLEDFWTHNGRARSITF